MKILLGGMHYQRTPEQAGIEIPDEFEIWARKACWRQFRHPAPAMSMYHGLRARYAKFYVRSYYQEHGRFPTGSHKVSKTETFYFPDDCPFN